MDNFDMDDGAVAGPSSSSSSTAAAAAAAAAKRKRQSQSCDACRVRKVKCEPASDEQEAAASASASASAAGISSGTTKRPCKHCIILGLECTYEYKPRKRGPPNLYLKRLQEAKAAGVSVHEFGNNQHPYAESGASSSRRNTASDIGGSGGGGGGGSGGGDGLARRSSSSARASTSTRPKVSRASTSLDAIDRGVDWDDAQRDNYATKTTYLDDVSGSIDPHLEAPGAYAAGGSNADDFAHLTASTTANTSFARHAGRGLAGGGYAGEGGVLDDEAPLPPRVVNNSDFAKHSHILRPSGASSSDAYLPPPASTTARSSTDLHGSSSGGHHHHHGVEPHSIDIDPALDPYGILAPSTSSSSLRDSLGGHHDGGLAMLRSQYGNNSAGSPSHHGSTTSTATNLLPRSSAISPGQSANNPYGGYFTSPSDAGSTDIMNASRSYHAAGGAGAAATIGSTGSGAAGGSASNHLVPPSSSVPLYDLASETLGSIGASRHAASSSSQAFASISSPMSNMLNPDRTQLMARAASTHHHNPLDTILPRPLLLLIINLFFDYVYPLTPCLHKPTFLRDLMSRREERPGQDEWVALVLATVMSTLVQVPRAFVPLSRREVRDLAAKCYKETRKWTLHGYKEASVAAVVVRYFSAIYNYVRGFVVDCHTSLNEAQALSIVMRLHEEESYHFLNPIEREMRRRIFFLLFGADKSEAVLLGRPIRMREEDCYSLHLPEELDDEYITETRYLPQPPGVTSIITGFNASTRVHCHLGRMMTKHREDKRDPPSGARLQQRLNEIDQMLEDVMSVMTNCPPALRLKNGLDSRVQSPAGGWDAEVSAKLQDFFFNPSASREVAKDAFLVQQGNVYVNQQLARFVLLQYRNDLLTLKHEAELETSPAASRSHGFLGETALGDGFGGKDGKDHVASEKENLFYDLLTVLHSIPIQSIAVNGPALVNCVRYVASALLDTVQGKTARADSNASGQTELSSSVLRAQGYLIDFLSILSEIEKNYQLDEEPATRAL